MLKSIAAGTCQCSGTRYTGPDCSLDLQSAIELVIPVNNGLCDVRANNCSIAQLLGVGFLPQVTTCITQPVSVRLTHVQHNAANIKFFFILLPACEMYCHTCSIGSKVNLTWFGFPKLSLLRILGVSVIDRLMLTALPWMASPSTRDQPFLFHSLKSTARSVLQPAPIFWYWYKFVF